MTEFRIGTGGLLDEGVDRARVRNGEGGLDGGKGLDVDGGWSVGVLCWRVRLRALQLVSDFLDILESTQDEIAFQVWGCCSGGATDTIRMTLLRASRSCRKEATRMSAARLNSCCSVSHYGYSMLHTRDKPGDVVYGFFPYTYGHSEKARQ